MRGLAAVAGVVAGLVVGAGEALAAPIEVGARAPRVAVSCPESCQAIGRVTGFQVRQGERRNAYRIRREGKVVAFTIALGRPNAEQSRFFTRLFGGPPQVRLSVLRPGSRQRHRLTGQSEVFDVAPYLGSSTTFALDRPLTVRPGYVIALTVPTWAPAFGVGLAPDEVWRSSRDRTNCSNVRRDAAQQRRASLRTYGCVYRTARLLYTATFIPNPRPTSES